MASERWVRACGREELEQANVVAAEADGLELALYLVEGQPFASDDLCTHGAARLSEGYLIDNCIECPLHQGQFDVRTGQPLCEPVTQPIRVYPARFAGDSVEVDVSAPAAA